MEIAMAFIRTKYKSQIVGWSSNEKRQTSWALQYCSKEMAPPAKGLVGSWGHADQPESWCHQSITTQTGDSQPFSPSSQTSTTPSDTSTSRADSKFRISAWQRELKTLQKLSPAKSFESFNLDENSNILASWMVSMYSWATAEVSWPHGCSPATACCVSWRALPFSVAAPENTNSPRSFLLTSFWHRCFAQLSM